MTATLFINGPILSMDDNNSEPEAVLIVGNLIAAVGDEASLRAKMPDGTKLHDLKGQALIPAFLDTHGHFPDPGFIALFRVDLSSPPRGNCVDMTTALERLGEKARSTPKGEWVMGVLFDNTAIAEGRMPSREELDSVSLDHPIWVLHASGHNGVANSLALEMQGITQDTSDTESGRFGRATDGKLTGLIEGISAMGEMGDTDFLIDRDKFWAGFKACRDEYIAHGVTFAQNAWTSRKMLEHFASLPAGEDPGIDLLLLPIGELEPELSDGPNALEWAQNPYVTLGPRKLFTDGAFQLQTAYLSQPYHRVTDPDHPCGMPYMSPKDHRFEVRKLHNLGHQIHCHCNGDAGADLFIDAVAAAQADNPRDDHRHTIIHGQTLRDDQLERMADLGITVSFFSAHIHFWGDLHKSTFLGPDRANRLSPAASAEKYGVRYTLHNDASVTPTRPLHLAHCAVNRRTSGGQTLGEAQKISALSALRAQTIDAAWQVFQEDVRGSIEVGKTADLVILSGNPLHDPKSLKELRVICTIRRGNICD